jgi:hypothetical protein
MGAVPAGVVGALVQSVDAGVVGSLPLAVALARGAPEPALVAGQLAWSLVVAAAALGWLTRRSRPR